MNLIHEQFDAHSYYCTWSSQSSLCALYPHTSESPSMRDMLREETVFGENGLIRQFPGIRSSLYFVFDDGWDIPYGLHNNEHGDFGSLIVNDKRFPFCMGEPKERLKALADRVASFGWKGTGIWVCAGGKGEVNSHLFTCEERERYWRERLQWSKYAGISYWKVDWGCYGNNVDFRCQLNAWKSEEYPELIIEHAGVCGPISGINQSDLSPQQSGRFADWEERPQEWGKLAAFSDIIRTYDVSPFLSVPTTIDRVQYLLRIGECIRSNTIINAEDEAYICAALGLAIGIMRNQLRNRSGKPFCRNTTETIRAVRWLTAFAPPYPIGIGETRFGKYILTDFCHFDGRNCWISSYGDRDIPQGAPALVARNYHLPDIEYLTDEKPYVVLSMHPNEAVSLTVLPRFSEKTGRHTPPVKITILQHIHNPVTGVFGYLEELTVIYDAPLSGKRIMVQDLADDTAEDITDKCVIADTYFTVRGSILSNIGTKANAPDDASEPGVVITLI